MSTGQLALGLKLRDSSVFASYFGGRNQAAVSALRALGASSGAGSMPTCIWLHGPAGVGKTHLLQATCASAHADDRPAAYVPLQDAVVFGEDLLAGYGEFALVCLDDAEAIAGHDRWERAIFRLHQELYERGGHLIVSAAVPPGALRFRLADLASRLNGGLVLTLHALEEPEQIAALQLRAQLRGFELPDDTAQFMLRRLPRDMASLCAFLDELDEASLIAQRRLTVPFVREVMSR